MVFFFNVLTPGSCRCCYNGSQYAADSSLTSLLIEATSKPGSLGVQVHLCECCALWVAVDLKNDLPSTKASALTS
eukprot:scaffold336535_cov35-Prasinocladus_malaysianus.AAC.1